MYILFLRNTTPQLQKYPRERQEELGRREKETEDAYKYTIAKQRERGKR